MAMMRSTTCQVDRLDVSHIGHLGVGHDGRGIAVDQDDAVPLFAQGLAGLGAGVVEFASLPDDNGAGADNEDAFFMSLRLGIFLFLRHRVIHQTHKAIK